MLSLKTALQQGVEVHRRFRAQPPAVAGSPPDGKTADAAIVKPPQALAFVADNLTPPEAVTAPGSSLEVPIQPEITFEPPPPAGTAAAAEAEPSINLLEQSLRRSLRRYPSIQRREDLL